MENIFATGSTPSDSVESNTVRLVFKDENGTDVSPGRLSHWCQMSYSPIDTDLVTSRCLLYSHSLFSQFYPKQLVHPCASGTSSTGVPV